MKIKANKAEVIRARCDESLKRSVLQVAALENIDEADVIRRACIIYARSVLAPRGQNQMSHAA
jgi:hypothetical protein